MKDEIFILNLYSAHTLTLIRLAHIQTDFNWLRWKIGVEGENLLKSLVPLKNSLLYRFAFRKAFIDLFYVGRKQYFYSAFLSVLESSSVIECLFSIREYYNSIYQTIDPHDEEIH